MKKILFSVVLALGISKGQAQVVSDPAAHGHLLTSVGVLEKLGDHAFQLNDRITSLNDGIGVALGPLKSLQELIKFGLLLAGGCEDPFAGLKGYFLGVGKFKFKIDFCSLVESQMAYRSLLFLPQGQLSPQSFSRLTEELKSRRQEMIQESVSNTLAVSSLQKKQVVESRKVIADLRQEFMETAKNLRDDMRYNNLLLSVVAEELTNIRILLVQQSEVQASTAAEQVRFPVMRG